MWNLQHTIMINYMGGCCLIMECRLYAPQINSHNMILSTKTRFRHQGNFERHYPFLNHRSGFPSRNNVGVDIPEHADICMLSYKQVVQIS